MAKKQRQIYTGLELKQIKKITNRKNRSSWAGKNIISNENRRWDFFEKIIKYFLRFILWLTTSKIGWKNKVKTNELVDRTYAKFIAKDSAFIPFSLAFYFLVSFVPISTIVIVLLSFIDDYNVIFVNKIITRVIPGVQSLLAIPEFKINEGAKYTAILVLLLTSTWLGSSGWGRFIYLQNYIYGHENLGNFFLNRIKGFFVVLGISIYIFLASALYITFYKWITPSFSLTGETIFFYISLFIYLLLILYLGFTLIYKLTPSFKLQWNSVLPGVLVASIPNMIFISGFGYLTSLLKYDQYGTIGTFLYLALFVSSLTYFTYMGLIVNESYFKTYYSSFTISKTAWIFKRFNKI
ncbi:membrane protein [Mycoplasmopsis californica]|uniref:Membrane protein n=2 Tax=Mycoplasmopsis californica TaxID=2113 RepID=A0A059XSF2_9BACT|nr:YhjD/YihY/BrkB family envelope integrity protein [Mycoplasmopsis californica]AIA29733.1 membrane protein [Mycoplasmopsis californica]